MQNVTAQTKKQLQEVQKLKEMDTTITKKKQSH